MLLKSHFRSVPGVKFDITWHMTRIYPFHMATSPVALDTILFPSISRLDRLLAYLLFPFGKKKFLPLPPTMPLSVYNLGQLGACTALRHLPRHCAETHIAASSVIPPISGRSHDALWSGRGSRTAWKCS